MPATHRVNTPAGRFETVSVLVKLPRWAWQRLRTGHGTKGDRHYDWAMIEILGDDTPPGQAAGHSLKLVRRHRYPRQLSFYRCHSATPVALGDLGPCPGRVDTCSCCYAASVRVADCCS
ncbi:hypothetical protein ACIQWB_02755 [Streptomyces olivaceus]|uniref:hypothetical protein n=1 Tax=Streptomyces olivaceus TaxID=47716 RepID=UPI00381B5975